MIRSALPGLALLLASSSCRSVEQALAPREEVCPVPGGERVDDLIQDGERHFARLWKITAGGENAEGYWSFAGDRLVFQRTDPEHGVDCDRIYVTAPGGTPRQISNGRGITTCAFFLPGDDRVLYATTQAHHDLCPPKPGREEGYVWAIHPQYDIVVRDLRNGSERTIIGDWGYDAEATLSPKGDRVVYTSTASGDLELWTCDFDGSNRLQVTDQPGYDGGAFFSHDAEWLVFRSTSFDPADYEAAVGEYERLLARWLVRPSDMEIMLVRPDGTDRRQVTQLGGANWAPYFFPDDSRILFCTNHHGSPREFDLFAIDVDGSRLERITTYEGFDSFPMFSPDGRWLAFASNRGGETPGETNLFVAEWRD